MLHRGASRYASGRSDDLLKLKPYLDAEARVVAHLPGKGKYRGLMGALLVESTQGGRFRIGTGFSDAERVDPPPIGAQITYRYHGFTDAGIPRFPSFLRVREEP
jgi:DNA ligase-1